MLIYRKKVPMVAKEDMKVFKVMLKYKNKYYVCPPAFTGYYYMSDGNLPPSYELNVVHETDCNDSEHDYRMPGTEMIGPGFFHTFVTLDSAQDFKAMIESRLNFSPMKLMSKEEFTMKMKMDKNFKYSVPYSSKIVILHAIIPKGSIYYKGPYKEVNGEETMASNKLIYIGEL